MRLQYATRGSSFFYLKSQLLLIKRKKRPSVRYTVFQLLWIIIQQRFNDDSESIIHTYFFTDSATIKYKSYSPANFKVSCACVKFSLNAFFN